MTKRTRYFVAVASTILVAGLCTGVVAYYSGGLPLMASRAGAPQDLAYVPADASMVGYADVREIMNSDFRQKIKAAMPTGEGRDEFFQETGIDIERDVTSVLAAVSRPDRGHPEQDTVILVRGVFEQGRIEAVALQHGATVADYKGRRIVGADGKGVVFLEPGLVAVGSPDTLRRAIDAREGGVNVTTNAEVMRLVNDLDGNNNAWAVGRMTDFQKVEGLPEPVRAQLPMVQWFAVSGHVNGGLSGSIRAEARDDQAAENLRDVIKGGMALARLQMGRDAKLDAMINTLQMTGTGKNVQLSFAVPAEIIDAVAGFATAKERQHDGKNQK